MMSTTLRLSDPFGDVAIHDVGSGEPLVLIHGVGMCASAWEPQVGFLSQTHRVIAVNMPGHGGSSLISENAQLPEYVAWFDAVMVALGLDRANIAGHSMGALIAGGYAATHPEKTSRVALLNSVYQRTNDARNAVLARADEIRQGAFDLATPLARWFGDSAAEQEVRARVSAWLSEVDHAGYAAAYGAFARGDQTYAARFADIRCPFLALTGDGDKNSTPEMAQEMVRVVSNGRASIITGHRHMVNLTAPDQVNAALVSWLNTSIQGDVS